MDIDGMQSFRDMINVNEDFEVNNENWTKEDLIELLDELEDEDLVYITEEVLDILSYDEDFDWENMEDTKWSEYEKDSDVDADIEIAERLNKSVLKKAAQKRRKPAYKKAMRLKKKCMSKYSKKVNASKGKANTFVCGTDGKIHKGMSKAKRRLMAKTRKKNKSKITK